jgi:hypothetical protein
VQTALQATWQCVTEELWSTVMSKRVKLVFKRCNTPMVHSNEQES